MAPAKELSGRIAWSSHAPPWRAGVAFDDGSVSTAVDFFTRLAAAYPGVDTLGHAPDRVPEDGTIAPAPPPPITAVLSSEEVAVLLAVGDGLAASALRARLGDRWGACVNAMFALLGRGYLVLGAVDSAAAVAWAPHLARAAAARS